MGTVEDVVISRDEGRAQFILDVGGLLGEDKRVSVPLRELEQRQTRLVCNICRTDMEQEPGYGSRRGESGSKSCQGKMKQSNQKQQN